MLSYNDIISYKFEKAGFGGGYKPEDVDKFTMRLATDFQKLEAEKAELEQKLMALAQKVEEYREDEESLRAALLGAQKLGDSIIRESKQKAEQTLDAARQEADRLVGAARAQIEREQFTLTKIQKEVSNFKSRLLVLYKQHLELISSMPGQDVTVDAQEIINGSQNPQPRQEAPVPPEAAEPERPLEEPLPEPAVEEERPEESAAPEASAHEMPRESRFGELKFGEGYDLTRK